MFQLSNLTLLANLPQVIERNPEPLEIESDADDVEGETIDLNSNGAAGAAPIDHLSPFAQ